MREPSSPGANRAAEPGLRELAGITYDVSGDTNRVYGLPILSLRPHLCGPCNDFEARPSISQRQSRPDDPKQPRSERARTPLDLLAEFAAKLADKASYRRSQPARMA